MREPEFVSKTEAAALSGVSGQVIHSRIAAGKIRVDPVSGKINREAFEQSMPWLREARLRNIVAGLPLGQVAVILVDALGKEHLATIFNLVGLPGADCDTAGNASS